MPHRGRSHHGHRRCRTIRAAVSRTRRDLGGALLLPGFIDSQVNGGGGVLFNDAPSVESIRAHRRGAPPLRHDRVFADPDQRRPRHGRARHRRGPRRDRGRRARRARHPHRGAVPQRRAQGRARSGEAARARLERDRPAHLPARRPHAGHARAGDDHAADHRAAGGRGSRGLRRAHQRDLRADRGGAAATASPASRTCSTPCRSSRGASPARWVRRSTMPTAGAASSSTARIRIRWCCASRCAASAHDRFMLVTDAMPSVGTPDQSFELQGRQISVRGQACVDEDGRLAGSNIDMASCVRNAVSMLGVSLAEAVRMASQWPAEFLGLGRRIRPHRGRLPRQSGARRRRAQRARDLDRRANAPGGGRHLTRIRALRRRVPGNRPRGT